MFTKKQIILIALVFIIFMPVLVLAGTIDLPQTGQTKCYDTSGTEIACAGTGQDGEIQAGVNKNAIIKKVSALQIPFMENHGQIKDKSVRFYVNTFAGTVFVTEKGEVVYSLIKTEDRGQNTGDRTQTESLRAERSNLKSSSGSE